MTENELRKELAKGFDAYRPSAHLSWVESHATSAGFPDADMCVDSLIAQVELKVVKAKGAIEIRSTQYRWFKDRVNAGGKPVMLIGSDDGFYILPGESVFKPDALINIDQIRGRRHIFSFTMSSALDAVLMLAKHGVAACPR